MKKVILQGRKDAIKADLLVEYEMCKTFGSDVTETTDINGKKTIARSTKLPDGRILVEIDKL